MPQSIKNGWNKLTETYFIAEAGNNHNGEIEMAKQLVDLAVTCGANGVKFQKRDLDHMFTADVLDAPFTNVPAWGKTQREVRGHIELNKQAFIELRDYCKQKKIDFIVTPFDLPSLEILEEVGVDLYKIASHSMNDTPLLEAVAKTGKPVVMSVNMGTEQDINDAIEPFKKEKTDLAILHCVSSYPLPMEDANLQLINYYKKFGYPVGWSDHENGITLGPVAVALGAKIVEKHYTLNRILPGFDHAMSLEPDGLKRVIRNIRKTETAMKGLTKPSGPLPNEMKCFETRRKSIVAAKDIKKGQKISRDMLVTKGPNKGLPPKMIPELIGKEALENIKADTHITFSKVKI